MVLVASILDYFYFIDTFAALVGWCEGLLHWSFTYLVICTVSLSQGHVNAYDFLFSLRSFLYTEYMFVSRFPIWYIL